MDGLALCVLRRRVDLQQPSAGSRSSTPEAREVASLCDDGAALTSIAVLRPRARRAGMLATRARAGARRTCARVRRRAHVRAHSTWYSGRSNTLAWVAARRGVPRMHEHERKDVGGSRTALD